MQMQTHRQKVKRRKVIISLKRQCWEKLNIVKNEDPDVLRQDKFGNMLCWYDYGKNDEFGWVIDHMKPIAKYGTNHINNFQALQTGENWRKGSTYHVVYPNVTVYPNNYPFVKI